MHEPDPQELLCYGAQTCKFKVVQLTHSPPHFRPAPVICSVQGKSTRGGFQRVLSSLLPKDGSNPHIGSIHEDTRVTKLKVRPTPAYPTAIPWPFHRPRDVHMAMAIFGRTDPRKRPKQDLALATGHWQGWSGVEDGLGVRTVSGEGLTSGCTHLLGFMGSSLCGEGFAHRKARVPRAGT